MSFAAPLWLLAGALAAIVLLLHALRHNRVEVPSLILWRRLATATRSRSTIRPPRWSLLLLLQLLAVLALALALAQPIIGPNAGRVLHDIYVLDASAGMRATDVAPSRFDAALTQLIAELPNRGDGSRISVAVGGGAPELLFARQSEGEALIAPIRALTAGDGTADWPGLAQKLAGLIRDGEETRITLWTSGQGDAAAALTAALPGAAIDTRLLGDPQSPNAGITATIAPVADAPGKWRLTASLALQATAAPSEVALRFQPLGGDGFLEWGRAVPVLAPDGQTVTLDEELTLPSDGVLQLVLPPDLQPADNSFGLVVRSAPPRLRVLYIGAGNRPLHLSLLSRGDVDLFSAPGLPRDADSYDLVIPDNVVLPRRPLTNTLWLGTARLEGEPEPVSVTGKPTGWNSTHPLSASVRWSGIRDIAAVATPAPHGAVTLLSSAEGPLISARTMPIGRDVRIDISLDPNGFAATPDFPMLIGNILDWLAADPLGVCTEGTSCDIPARLVGQPIHDENGATLATAPATNEWLLDEANSFTPHRAGIYTIGSGPTQAVRIVNAAPILPAAAPPVTSEAQPVPTRPFDATPWLVLIAAALLLAEAIIAGRGPERFLRREAMAAGVPGLRQRRWTLALRGATLLFIAAAVLAIPLLSPRQGDDTVLIIEPGTSGDPRRAELLAAADNPACIGMPAPSLGLVALAATPYVASDLSCSGAGAAPATARASPEPAADIGAAIELATAMLRPGANGRIVIASDGSDTGTTLGAARNNIAVDVLPLTDRPAGDTIITAVESTGRPVEGDRLPIRIMIDAATSGTTKLAISADGVPIDEIEVDLTPGSNVVDAFLPEAAAGGHVIDVALVNGADPVPQNDRFAMALDVAARPKLAIVTPERDWGDYFARALALQGIDSTVIAPADAPTDLAGWLDYDAVALMNLPAIDLSSTQQDQLETYVRTHGRGLLLLGGENSFGPGGYYQTPLEALSPLSARIPKDMPIASMGFVLDRSGSMRADVDGVSRLDIAKSATLSAIELLNDESAVSVIVFDTQATLLVPMQDRKDVAAVETALMRVAPGGGTSISPGLAEMLDEMRKSRDRVRHIVVMSDGQSQGGDPLALTRAARARGITISTVAIGSGADVTAMQNLARDGGGSFHYTQDVRALPAIMSQEAITLSGKSMEPGTRPVAWLDRSEAFLDGLPATMPEIESYVLTTAKPEARLHLATLDDDGDTVPILASWQYGNGAVLALATHAAGPGSIRWMALPEYPLLWSQIVRGVLPAIAGPGMSVTIERNGGQGTLIAEILSPDGEPISGLSPVANLARDGQPFGAPLPLTMLAPGRYTARFAADVPGAYTADITADGFTATASLAVAYAPRLDFTRAQPERLEALAAATGGQVLSGTSALATSTLAWQWNPVWRPWLLLALLLFIADLAIRYIPGRFAFLRDARPFKESPLAQR